LLFQELLEYTHNLHLGGLFEVVAIQLDRLKSDPGKQFSQNQLSLMANLKK